MKNVIVTGANGFLGKALVRALLDRGYRVVALDLCFDGELAGDDRVTCVNVRGREVPALGEELPAQEYLCLFHLAWAGTSGPARADYAVQLDNARLACDYVVLASKIGCRRVIYASSISETETYAYLQADDAEPAGGHIYGAGKLAAHLMAQTVAGLHGVGFIPVVMTNVYGAGERSSRLICSSVDRLLRGEHCAFTAGEQTYDFIYVTDAVQAIIAVAERGRASRRYYIGSGEPRPLREFLLQMRDVVDPQAQLGLGELPFRGVDIDYSRFDVHRVERETGYVNRVSFTEGIRMTADDIRGEA